VIRAVIFDMDGVLIDTEPTWRAIEVATFTGLGLSLTEDDSVQTMGVRLPEVVAHWYGLQPWDGPSVEEVSETILSRVITHVADYGEPMDGVRAALTAIRSAGLQTAIASSSSLRLIRAVVERLGIGADIDVLCSADGDAQGKPHPAVYLRTAKLLGCQPDECLAIEDSPNGVRSAVAAGMACIAIPDPAAADDPAFELAHEELHSLAEITPAWLAPWLLPDLLAEAGGDVAPTG